MGSTWYEALMELRNRWVVCKRTPKNLCRKCLLKVNCSKFCQELSTEVLGEAIDQVGIGLKISDTRRELNVIVQPIAAAEKIDLSFSVNEPTN